MVKFKQTYIAPYAPMLLQFDILRATFSWHLFPDGKATLSYRNENDRSLETERFVTNKDSRGLGFDRAR